MLQPRYRANSTAATRRPDVSRDGPITVTTRLVDKLARIMLLVLLSGSALLAGGGRGTASESAAGPAANALALCCEADQLSGAEKQHVLRRGLELAEGATAGNPSDARAHFAVFCNLGKQLQSRALGPSDLRAINRLRHELDIVLVLAPNDTDALVAKGAMLLALPWFFGGDARQAEELLRTALVQNPANVAARRYLAKALRSRGADDEASAVEMLDIGAASPEVPCAPADLDRRKNL
jgi:hypothetical protein